MLYIDMRNTDWPVQCSILSCTTVNDIAEANCYVVTTGE